VSKEIKFRAWDKETGKMHYQINKPRTDENINDELIIQFDCTGYSARTKNKYIGSDCLMQYTGLKDKNGKEIFEGDVVFSESNQYYKQDEIVWDCYDMGWDIGKKDSWKLRSPMSSKTEIIGSIYENPELITGVKNG
jgi:uncharacterized phage protein (TIGR01671 family)